MDSVLAEWKKTGKPEMMTKEEVGAIMKSLGMPWGSNEEKELENTVDVKDGKLNFVEFVTVCFGGEKFKPLLISDKAETEIGQKRLKAKHGALKAAVDQGFICEEKPLTLFIDEDDAKASVKRLMAAFPPSDGFFHCFAVKANPTLEYLKILGSEGMGFESASMGELTNALRAMGVKNECFPAEFGFPNGGTEDFPKWFEKAGKTQGLVIDSPIKTRKEIAFTLKHGVPINVDNFDELYRIDDWMKANEASRPDISLHPLYGRIGIRINPQVGGGSNAQLSTGTATSKFGVGLNDDRNKVVQAYLDRPWLNMVHGHVGSQGIPMSLMMAGIRVLVELIREVNGKGGKIDVLDMGGGLTVNFGAEDVIPSYQDLADQIKVDVPGIFGADKVVPTIMTEMGRTLSAKSGWLGSRIEYTKHSGGLRIMAQHAGVDICVRTIYHPDSWPLRITCYGKEGAFIPFKPDGDDVEPTNVSGPCCIAGDVIAWKRPLPKSLKEGDILMVHDVGGYYHSSYSKYNSRQSPPLIGYTTAGDGKVTFRTLQKAETVKDTLAYFDP